MNEKPVVHCQSVVKRRQGPFGPAALAGVNLKVQSGEVVLLLGPNGSGKTTLLQLLAGLIHPTEGIVEVFGSQRPEDREGRIAWLPERENYSLNLTALEYLFHMGRLSGLSREECRSQAAAGLDSMNLGGVKHARLRTFSAGMLKRTALAALHLGNPALYLLDEPTQGLEPDSRRDFFQNIRKQAEKGKTVILSTHHPDMLPPGPIRRVQLKAGQILFDGPVEEFAAGPFEGFRIRLPLGATVPPSLLEGLPCSVETGFVKTNPREIIIQTGDPAVRKLILERLLAANLPPEEMTPLQAGIEPTCRKVPDKGKDSRNPS